MSFSSKTKNQICRDINNNECCILCELSAIVHMCGSIKFEGNKKISFILKTENAAIARRTFRLLKRKYRIITDVLVKKNRQFKGRNIYVVTVPSHLSAREILLDLGIIKCDKNGFITFNYSLPNNIIKNDCCKRAYLRGAFLGGGSITDPKKTYHMEFVCQDYEYAIQLRDLINSYDLNAKIVERKSNNVVYIKEGEQLITLLNVVGAHQALLAIENIRIMKEMRNNVNRIVNCETANLSKTVNAAYRQIENIKYIKKYMGLHKLSQNLQEAAELRLNYQDSSLKELGQMLHPPVGKSGINHRLKKIEKIAEDLRISRGEL